MYQVIYDVAKSRNIKVIDSTHLDINSLAKLTVEIRHRNDIMILYKTFQKSKSEILIFNDIMSLDVSNNITIYFKADYMTMPTIYINALNINTFIDDTLSDCEIQYCKCPICLNNCDTLERCLKCYKSICKDCLVDNLIKNNTKKCAFCKSYEFNIEVVDGI